MLGFVWDMLGHVWELLGPRSMKSEKLEKNTPAPRYQQWVSGNNKTSVPRYPLLVSGNGPPLRDTNSGYLGTSNTAFRDTDTCFLGEVLIFSCLAHLALNLGWEPYNCHSILSAKCICWCENDIACSENDLDWEPSRLLH